MDRYEHHTQRHAASPDWQEPSWLREAIGRVIGKKPLPGKEYDNRARVLATTAVFALGVSAALGVYGLGKDGFTSHPQETTSSTTEFSTTEINTDPMNLRRDVVEAIEAQGYDPTKITIVWPDFAAEHQGQDPRTADHTNETYEVIIEDGVATVTPVK